MVMPARTGRARIWQWCRRAPMLLIASVAFVNAPSATQSQSAGERSIRGIVRDTHGVVLSGVRLAATSPETGHVVTAVTDDTGTYRLVNLPPGPYIVSARHHGFMPFARPNVSVRAGSSLGFDVTLTANARPPADSNVGGPVPLPTTTSHITH
jgi:hypothetical protein